MCTVEHHRVNGRGLSDTYNLTRNQASAVKGKPEDPAPDLRPGAGPGLSGAPNHGPGLSHLVCHHRGLENGHSTHV